MKQNVGWERRGSTSWPFRIVDISCKNSLLCNYKEGESVFSWNMQEPHTFFNIVVASVCITLSIDPMFSPQGVHKSKQAPKLSWQAWNRNIVIIWGCDKARDTPGLHILSSTSDRWLIWRFKVKTYNLVMDKVTYRNGFTPYMLLVNRWWYLSHVSEYWDTGVIVLFDLSILHFQLNPIIIDTIKNTTHLWWGAKEESL